MTVDNPYRAEYLRQIERARVIGRSVDRVFCDECSRLGVDENIALQAPLQFIGMAQRLFGRSAHD